MPAEASPRRREIAVAARALIEEEGADALTMRRLADRLAIRAPSLYAHFPAKADLLAAVVEDGLREQAAALEGARDLTGLATAYRAFALAHPHLHALMTRRPLPRERLPEGLEERAAAPLLRALGGDVDLARAAWAFAEGLVSLELAGRLPPGADLRAAWRAGVAAFAAAVSDRAG